MMLSLDSFNIKAVRFYGTAYEDKAAKLFTGD